jgi:hypothetical protein
MQECVGLKRRVHRSCRHLNPKAAEYLASGKLSHDLRRSNYIRQPKKNSSIRDYSDMVSSSSAWLHVGRSGLSRTKPAWLAEQHE